jgi:TRAP-type C4-dicarboxylate transport system permease small subunit
MSDFLGRIDRAIASGCRWGVNACMLALFALLALAIVQRMLPVFKIPGYDELVELLFGWMVFLGGLALWREGTLYKVELLERALHGTPRRVLEAVIHLCMLAIAAILAYAGWQFTAQSGETTPFLGVDKSWWYAAIPVCGTLMCGYSVAAMWRALRGEVEAPRELATLS